MSKGLTTVSIKEVLIGVVSVPSPHYGSYGGSKSEDHARTTVVVGFPLQSVVFSNPPGPLGDSKRCCHGQNRQRRCRSQGVVGTLMSLYLDYGSRPTSESFRGRSEDTELSHRYWVEVPLKSRF